VQIRIPSNVVDTINEFKLINQIVIWI
jgi:hypothetical protein